MEGAKHLGTFEPPGEERQRLRIFRLERTAESLRVALQCLQAKFSISPGVARHQAPYLNICGPHITFAAKHKQAVPYSKQPCSVSRFPSKLLCSESSKILALMEVQ